MIVEDSSNFHIILVAISHSLLVTIFHESPTYENGNLNLVSFWELLPYILKCS